MSLIKSYFGKIPYDQDNKTEDECYNPSNNTSDINKPKGYYANTQIFPKRMPRKRPKGIGKLYRPKLTEDDKM